MSERVNKLYRPADLSDAIDAVQAATKDWQTDWQHAANIIKVLHKNGWKVVRCEAVKVTDKS